MLVSIRDAALHQGRWQRAMPSRRRGHLEPPVTSRPRATTQLRFGSALVRLASSNALDLVIGSW